MQIRVDLSGLEVEVKRSRGARKRVREALVQLIAESAIRTMYKVKSVMPVDTGRARARWGLHTPEHIVDRMRMSSGNVFATPIWKFRDQGLTHEQGISITPHNYVEDLNLGTSQQAPMMFLDAIAEDEAVTLHNEALRVVGDVI